MALRSLPIPPCPPVARRNAFVLLWAMLCASVVAHAAGEVEDTALQWARQAVLTARENAGLRMEVEVGTLDSRLKLAPCGATEVYLPAGARLWGRTRVGVRCVDGVARWNVMVPTTVRAFGPAWVVKTPVAAGTVLRATDGVACEVDWAQENAAVLQDSAAWAGQAATRALTTGQTLREGMVRAPQVFQAGAQVRVVVQGPGFQIASEAQALSAGVMGQAARVRMDNGRVTSGTVLDEHTVRIDL